MIRPRPKFFIDWYDRHWIRILWIYVLVAVAIGLSGYLWLLMIPIGINILLGVAAQVSMKKRIRYIYGE